MGELSDQGLKIFSNLKSVILVFYDMSYVSYLHSKLIGIVKVELITN